MKHGLASFDLPALTRPPLGAPLAWSSRQVVTGDPDPDCDEPAAEADEPTAVEIVPSESEHPGSIAEALSRACEAA